MPVVPALRDGVRGAIVLAGQVKDPRLRPWRSTLKQRLHGYHALCNICGWHGLAFDGVAHSESAQCPNCGAIARDRFLYHCWTARTRYRKRATVLETSPRLGADYRDHMSRRVDYLCSDFDESAHRAQLHIDLQQIDLPDSSLDAVLTPHVLEHVPDTGSALRELYRVMRPDGSVFLMIPVPQGRTAKPVEPEYHADNTLVHWRFGWDLTDQIRAAGFHATILVPQELYERCRDANPWDYGGDDADVKSLIGAAGPYLTDMHVVADERTARRLGFEPGFFFIVWECRKPA
ncbi:MAG: methyltransferase domain-containing protein [Frankia sp.]|nr:methyltransferase domain-containing protein [Frankia sp.]